MVYFISIYLLLTLLKKGWLGRVVDYYDSHGIMNTQNVDLLTPYQIDINNVDEFVSYVSISLDNIPLNIILNCYCFYFYKYL